jgi:4-diphosphocytidyl-2-C-methyl-D-erythritol kinase
MIGFPHAKINLGLFVISKRPDGYHNLETVFYSVLLRDALEIVPSDQHLFFQTGLGIPGKQADNLVLRACRLLEKHYPQIKPLEIHLHKAIPPGAGLGGGSSDAAEIIRLLNSFYSLKISSHDLLKYASEIGSDCSFFMQSNPCFATGRGEILEPLPLDLSSYSMLLVHPKTHIDTAWAFSKIKPGLPKYNLKQSISKPLKDWTNTIFNDFEIPVFEAHPHMRIIKDRLYEAGAVYASMTGSGSTIFGIFEKSAVPEISFENADQSVIR